MQTLHPGDAVTGLKDATDLFPGVFWGKSRDVARDRVANLLGEIVNSAMCVLFRFLVKAGRP